MRLLVIGDYIEDRYVFGTATRLCPEAPVPVIVPDRWKMSWGGAGLVTDQLAALSAGEVQARFMSYSLKERFFAGNHLICRVDSDNSKPPEHLLLPFGTDDLEYFDAFVVCDYSKGALNEGCARLIVAAGKPCFVDAKNHWHWYAGPNVTIFPNDREAQAPLFPPDPTQVIHSCEYQRVVHKLGKHGCKLSEAGREISLPATVSEVVDVTGAGDIFMAAFVYAWSIQLPTDHCLEFANILAGESCHHVGTWTAPKAFAEAVLDRLRASRASAAPSPDCSPGSTSTAHEQPLPPDQVSFPEGVSEFDIPFAGCDPEPAIRAVVEYSPPDEQTRPESPSGPTGLPGAPTPSDQETIDVPGKRWPKKPQSQSPTGF